MLVANVPSNSVADWKFQLLKSSPKKTSNAEDTPTDAKATDLSDTIFFYTKWQKKNNKQQTYGKPIEKTAPQTTSCLRFFWIFCWLLSHPQNMKTAGSHEKGPP